MTAFARYDIPDGYRGTERTIAEMLRLTEDGYKHPDVIALARQIVYEIPWKRYANEAAAILAWCQGNLRYVRDPVGVEHLQHPYVTIFQTRGGDCDELACVFSALCGAIGNPWGFRTVGTNPLQPTHFEHVYPLVQLPIMGWTAADPTFQAAPLGWEPGNKDLAPRWGLVNQNVVTTRRDWFPAKYGAAG